MNIKDFPEGKIITLSKPFDTRGKILYIIKFSCFSIAAIAFVVTMFASSNSIGLIIFAIVFGAVYLIAGYRFINKALQTEKLFIIKDSLTISRRGFLSHKASTYATAGISNFRSLDKPETTAHPLAGQTFDYLGFQTEQKVISEMHGDNRIAFDYNGKTVKFGENIYSWDFDEIERLICEVTGIDFRRGKRKIPHPME